MKKRLKGFTIVELIIVIAIVAILAAVLIPTFSSIIKKAHINNDITLTRNLNTQLKIYEAEHGLVTKECELNEVLVLAGCNEIKPASAKQGYHIFFDMGNHGFVLSKIDEEPIFKVDGGEKASAFYNKMERILDIFVIKSYALDDKEENKVGSKLLSENIFRMSAKMGGEGYYLVDTTGSNLAEAVTILENPKDGEEYRKAVELIYELEDDKNDRVSYIEYKELITNTIIMNEAGVFCASELDATKAVFFFTDGITKVGGNIEKYSSDEEGIKIDSADTILDNTENAEQLIIVIPSTVKQIDTNALLFIEKDKVTNVLIVFENPTLEIAQVLKANSTNALVKVVTMDEEDYYKVKGDKLYKSEEINGTFKEIEGTTLEATDEWEKVCPIQFAFPNTDKYMYRVGNQNAVAVDKLFRTDNCVIDDIVITTVNGASGEKTTMKITDGNGVASTVDALKFSGTGIVKVVAKSGNISSAELFLEVVEGINITGAACAIDAAFAQLEAIPEYYQSNLVLLNDIGLYNNRICITNGYTLYGNGFKITATSDGNRLNTNGMTEGFITMRDGATLDNVVLTCPLYPTAYIYADNVRSNSNLSPSTEGDRKRYMYQWSAVAATGDCTISNCYIFGGRNNVYVGGSVTIDNTVLENGTLANVQVFASDNDTVTLKNVTTIQKVKNATINNTANKMLGFGILFGGNNSTTNAKLVLEGKLNQYNWLYNGYAAEVNNDYVRTAASNALKQSEYQISHEGETYVNVGIAYLNSDTPIIVDNRTNKSEAPYLLKSISMMSVTGQTYSLTKEAVNPAFDAPTSYKPTKQNVYKPLISLIGHATKPNEEGCYWIEDNRINISFVQKSSFTLAALSTVDISVPNESVVSVSCDGASVSGNNVIFTQSGTYNLVYTVSQVSVYDVNGSKIADTSYCYTVPVKVTITKPEQKNATVTVEAGVNTTGLKSNSSGDRYYFFDIFDGLEIIDYDESGNAVTLLDGSENSKKNFLKLIAGINPSGDLLGGSANYTTGCTLTITLVDGRELSMYLIRDWTVANSPGGTKAVYLKTDGTTLYYVTNSAAGSNGYDTAVKNQTFYHKYNISQYKFTGFSGKKVEVNVTHSMSAGKYNDVWYQPTYTNKPSNNFTPIKTLIYNLNGGEISGNHYSQTSPTVLPIVTKEGCAFKGWNTVQDGSGTMYKAGSSYTINSTVTLYAQWGTPSTITYDANGGSCDTASYYYQGIEAVLPIATNGNMTFDGWFDAKEGGNRIGDSGEKYEPTKDITLYAHWSNNPKITFNANDGECDTLSAIYDGVKAIKLTNATRTGHDFTGWYDAKEDGKLIGESGASYKPSSSTTLYAHWKQKTFTVTIQSGGNGSVSLSKVENVPYGTIITASNDTVNINKKQVKATADDGYSFSSWTNGDATVTDNITVTANFSANQPPCFSSGTLITMADGTQKMAKDVKENDMILALNHFTGEYEATPVFVIFKSEPTVFEKCALVFSEGTEIEVINYHTFFDATLMQYVSVNAENVADYIGHSFVKYDSATGENKRIELISYEMRTEVDCSYSLISYRNINTLANGLLNVSDMLEGLYNLFDYGEDLKYSEEDFEAKITEYGLLDYDVWSDVFTYEQYVGFCLEYVNISEALGLRTVEQLKELFISYYHYVIQK